jgi:hypothetical protein
VPPNPPDLAAVADPFEQGDDVGLVLVLDAHDDRRVLGSEEAAHRRQVREPVAGGPEFLRGLGGVVVMNEDDE